jgi:hypothetical protein
MFRKSKVKSIDYESQYNTLVSILGSYMHDTSGILISMRGFIDLLKKDNPKLQKEKHKFLEYLGQNAEELSSLTSGLYNFYKETYDFNDSVESINVECLLYSFIRLDYLLISSLHYARIKFKPVWKEGPLYISINVKSFKAILRILFIEIENQYRAIGKQIHEVQIDVKSKEENVEINILAQDIYQDNFAISSASNSMCFNKSDYDLSSIQSIKEILKEYAGIVNIHCGNGTLNIIIRFPKLIINK